MQQSFSIQMVAWEGEHQSALKAIREAVFIQEQQVPVALEWDGEDNDAMHLIAFYQDEPIGCARVVQTKQAYKIGRMAVLNRWRRQGVGQGLLTAAIEYCQQQSKTIQLSAQTKVIPFYEQAGFIITSEPYLDAKIWHVDMRLTVND